MKILVAIASYGTNNDQYLNQLIDEYSSMPFHIDIVVLSNIDKNLDSDIELIVGLPSKNPWSLPFAHKPVFAQRLEQYDLFIYSEDDTLITERNINSFLQATEVLKEDEIAGFLRSEQGPDGALYYSTVHGYYHWDINSVRRRGSDVFAYFTNEHGACYMLTKHQLKKAIASGGFDVPPHEGRYDMLVSAATDPYTQCGFKKLICITRIDDFTCRHLTNKYIGRTGLDKSAADLQIQALMRLTKSNEPLPAAIPVEPKITGMRWRKSYYEPIQHDIVKLLPHSATNVLSIGCGSGNTEEFLVNKGLSVTAIPLDVVIGALAASKGIRVINDSMRRAFETLRNETFDVIIISNLLHLSDDPIKLMQDCRSRLKDDGLLITKFPNMGSLPIWLRRLARSPELAGLDRYDYSGVQKTSYHSVRHWLQQAGFAPVDRIGSFEGRWRRFDRVAFGVFRKLWASYFSISASVG